MPIVKEQLDLYFPTYLYDAERLRGVIIDASATHLPPVVGGNVEKQVLYQPGNDELSLRLGTKSLMVPALRALREEVAKTRVLRIISEHEGGLLSAQNKLESNISKARGKKRRPVWGKEGAVSYLATKMPVRELEFSHVALQRSLVSRPSERKKLMLTPSEESFLVIRGVQQTLLKGIRPTLRRGVSVDERVYEQPTCGVADIDTSQSDDAHVKQFLDVIGACLPITLPASEHITVNFSSYGDSVRP